jgi:ribokinase
MILVAGSANLDFVVRTPRLPGPGETVLGRELRTFPGGKGANQAIACARAGGVGTGMLVALGDDAYAEPIERSLRDAGVRLHVVRVAGRATGTAFICVSDEGENAIIVAPGANAALAPAHLPALAGNSHLLMQLETPVETVRAYAQAARAAGVKVVLNAAPAMELPPDLLSQVDVLIANEGELAALAGRQGSVAERIARIRIPSVVVTLGEGGCVGRVDGELVSQDAFRVTPVDTTAAGDTFCGVLVAALDRALAWREALRRASAAAAIACTRLGAQSSIPSLAEVEALLGSHAAATP